jgi:hypothetical protein
VQQQAITSIFDTLNTTTGGIHERAYVTTLTPRVEP